MGKSEYQKLVEEKKAAKKDLFKKSFAGNDIKTPLMIIFASDKENNDQKMLQLLEGLFVLPMKIIVVTNNEPPDLKDHPSGHITFVNNKDGREQPLIDEYTLAADMAIDCDSEHSRLLQVMEKGTVVIGFSDSPFLENYHPNDETGNSFTFDSYNPWDIFRAVVRATETYRFPYDWGNIIRAIIKGSQG